MIRRIRIASKEMMLFMSSNIIAVIGIQSQAGDGLQRGRVLTALLSDKPGNYKYMFMAFQICRSLFGALETE